MSAIEAKRISVFVWWVEYYSLPQFVETLVVQYHFRSSPKQWLWALHQSVSHHDVDVLAAAASISSAV